LLIAEKFIFTALKEYERKTPFATPDQSVLAAKVLNALKGVKQMKEVSTDTFKVGEKFEETWSAKLAEIEASIPELENDSEEDSYSVNITGPTTSGKLRNSTKVKNNKH